MNFENSHARLEMLLKELDTLPDRELLLKYRSDARTHNSLINFKFVNICVANTLESFFLGEEPKTTGDLNTDKLIALACMREQALFSLIFESWEYVKPEAIKERLLQPNAKPKDCYRIIKNQQYLMFYERYERTGKMPTARKVYDQANAGFKHNDNERKVSATELSGIKRTNMEEARKDDRQLNPPLLNLVTDIAYRYRHENPSLNLAADNWRNAVQAGLTLAKQNTHHQNKTR